MPIMVSCRRCRCRFPDGTGNTCSACRTAIAAVKDNGYDAPEFRAMRPRVVREQGGHCARCGQRRRLQVNHRDGNTRNNARDNLEGLCTSCHATVDAERRRRARNHGRALPPLRKAKL